MTATLAKFIIIMTLAFEVLTITTGATFYPAFALASAIILGCIIIQFTVPRITKKFNAMSRERKAFSHT